LLAHHFANAAIPDRAAGYFLRAGQIAIQRSALVEAMRHLERGLQVLESAPRTAERLRQELDLQLALGAARSTALGYAAGSAGEAYAEARSLCAQLGDTKRLYAVLTRQWVQQFFRAGRGAGLQTAEEILQFAGGRYDREALFLVAMSLYQLGKLEQAEGHLRQSLPLSKSVPDRAARGLMDGRAIASASHSALLQQLGYLDQADAQKGAALARARSLSHPHTLAFALSIICQTHWFEDDATGLAEHARELVTLSAEQGYSLFLRVGLIHLGRAKVQDGRVAEGIAEMAEGIAAYRATGA